MEIDSCMDKTLKQKAEELRALSLKSLESVSKLSYSSRGIPSDKDFHFFSNFDKFRVPVKEIADGSQRMLRNVGESSHVWGKDLRFSDDLDDAYDWLVNVNDELFESLDASLDEFRSTRRKDVDGSEMLDDGFQLVHGRNKRLMGGNKQKQIHSTVFNSAKSPAATVASRDQKALVSKMKVPFHIPAIPRPQNVFNILVDNSNQPFQHVWLKKSEDEMRSIHPLEHFCSLDFIDRNISKFEPKITPVEHTPFHLVEELCELKELADNLAGVDEFAVDLEHNQYRSFQGLTCLMQISTRTEDYVIDTLKLYVHVGPYLRDFFKDPKKRKVMHGADKDIFWLQRDFGIYVVNLFDTGQASKLLKLERKSLAYLLSHFCEVIADKEYQNADWRFRPLPDVMLNYARADTHYLLHIYDIMKERLLSMSAQCETSTDPLAEVYERSFNLCMRLYEKELMTNSSYLYIYGLHEVDFNAHQLSVVSGLFEWRDTAARLEDESTGYILPNKTLLEIAKQMPVTTFKLQKLLKSRQPYAECHLNSIVSTIRNSIQNASAFQSASELLKAAKLEKVCEENAGSVDRTRMFGPEKSINSSSYAEENHGSSLKRVVNMECENSTPIIAELPLGKDSHTAETMNFNNLSGITCSEKNVDSRGEIKGNSLNLKNDSKMYNEKLSTKGNLANVVIERKVSPAFGSMLGNSFATKKLQEDERKLKVIRSSVGLPFCSLSSPSDVQPPVPPASVEARNVRPEKEADEPFLGEIVELERVEKCEDCEKDEEQVMSLSQLSSGFHQCLPENRDVDLDVEPFDYKMGRDRAVVDRNGERDRTNGGFEPGGGTRRVAYPKLQTANLPQGRGRCAFPVTGNRSATFR